MPITYVIYMIHSEILIQDKDRKTLISYSPNQLTELNNYLLTIIITTKILTDKLGNNYKMDL